MHRKFIALIVSTAVAVTGLSLAARPVRADDTAKILAGIAAIALIGAAINNSNKSKVQIVTRQDPPYPVPRYHGPHEYNGPRHHQPAPPIQSRPTPSVKPDANPRPLPPRFTRYDLPKHCLMPANRLKEGKVMVGEKCLQTYYGATGSLPGSCRVTFWNGRENRTMYKPNCLEKHGYRLVRR